MGAWIAKWSSHLTFESSVCYALGREFESQWRQTLFRTQAQHLCFIHDSIWFVSFDTMICLSNLSCELWNRKLKIKEIYYKKYLQHTKTCITILKVDVWITFKPLISGVQSNAFTSWTTTIVLYCLPSPWSSLVLGDECSNWPKR